MDISTPEAEKNICFFLSPSAANICSICYVDISAKYPNDLNNSYKLKLWRGSEKNKTCWDYLETYLGEEIIRNRDFQSVCQSCFKKIKTQLNMKREKELLFQERRKMAEEHFLCWRSKPSSFLTPPTKKQLLYDKSNTSQPKPTSAVSITVRIFLHITFLNRLIRVDWSRVNLNRS